MSPRSSRCSSASRSGNGSERSVRRTPMATARGPPARIRASIPAAGQPRVDPENEHAFDRTARTFSRANRRRSPASARPHRTSCGSGPKVDHLRSTFDRLNGKILDMRFGDRLASWPVLRQLRGSDHRGQGPAVESARYARPVAPHRRRRQGRRLDLPVLRGRLRPAGATSATAQITQIEGNPDSPISRGRLCPKGSATKQLVTGADAGAQDQVPAPVRRRRGRTSASTRPWT